MKVYRIPVDSAARQSGHEFHFQWDLSGFSSERDMKGKTWESWSVAPSSTSCVLPGYTGTGFYGLSADAPYLRKKAMGTVIQGDRLNQAGTLRFRVMQDGAEYDLAVRPCLLEDSGAAGADFSFSHVFWQVSGLSPEDPISPTYGVFKVYLLR